jgi:hypothetical protein
MARAPRKKSEKQASSGILNALNFVSVAQKKKGMGFQTHCVFKNNTVCAFDGMLSAGAYIEEELNAAPQTETFKNALSLCGDTLTITQLDSARLAIKSGAFSAFVPCLTDDMPTIEPDPPQALADNRLIDGFKLISHLADEEKDVLALSSILVKSGSMIGTNGIVVAEFWHGIDFPFSLIMPKAAVTAILKINKKLVKFGFSQTTFTFYFDDLTWIKTQLFNGEWPDVEKVLNVASNPWPLFDNFYKAIAGLEKFALKDRAFFYKDKVQSSVCDSEGASFEIEGLPEGPIFAISQLKNIEGMFDKIDFVTYNDKAYFFGNNLRGAIMRCRE